MTSFASCYPSTSSRYTYGVTNYSFILLQVVLFMFDAYGYQLTDVLCCSPTRPSCCTMLDSTHMRQTGTTQPPLATAFESRSRATDSRTTYPRMSSRILLHLSMCLHSASQTLRSSGGRCESVFYLLGLCATVSRKAPNGSERIKYGCERIAQCSVKQLDEQPGKEVSGPVVGVGGVRVRHNSKSVNPHCC